MKTILVTLLTFSFFANTFAQTNFDQIFDQYAGQEGYTYVKITKYTFQLMAKVANEQEDQEFKEITKNLDGIRILTTSDHQASALLEVANACIKGKEYNELMEVIEGDDKIRFMIKEVDDKISDLVMIKGGGNEVVLLLMKGEIDLKQLSKLSKSMDIDGFEHLEGAQK